MPRGTVPVSYYYYATYVLLLYKRQYLIRVASHMQVDRTNVPFGLTPNARTIFRSHAYIK